MNVMNVWEVFGWYMLGALLHVLWRWSGWKKNNNDRRWIEYWTRTKHAALNAQAMIVAIILAFVWTQDIIVQIAKLSGIENFPHIERTALSSIFVGFILELVGARFLARWGLKLEGGS